MKKGDKYPHIVNVDEPTSVSNQEETPTEAKINGRKSNEMEGQCLFSSFYDIEEQFLVCQPSLSETHTFIILTWGV